MADVFDEEQLKIVHALALLLRGAPVILAGDELELKGRNEAESYMEWDATSTGCGFTNNTKVGHYLYNETRCENNALTRLAHSSDESLITIYATLSKLRKQPSFVWGEVHFSRLNNVISFVREAVGYPGYVVAANTNSLSATVDFKAKHSTPASGTVAYCSAIEQLLTEDFSLQNELNLNKVLLRPGQILVLKYKRE